MEQNGLTERPRCKVCGRRLRSTPWKYLLIGPVCARKNPELALVARQQYKANASDADGAVVDQLLVKAGVAV